MDCIPDIILYAQVFLARLAKALATLSADFSGACLHRLRLHNISAMVQDLKGKTALVTGATSGIGR